MKRLAWILASGACSVFALAHETEEAVSLWAEPTTYVRISAALILALFIGVLLKRDFPQHHKKMLFAAFALLIIVPTLFLGFSTIRENITSVTKGPVHWHADVIVEACGERLNLADPQFPRNKVGTPLLHEHNENRIHVEGTVQELDEVTLHHYFEVIGGTLEEGQLVYPTNEGLRAFSDGDACDEGTGTLKVYVNGKEQETYEEYVPYPDAYVPPGDCVVVRFSANHGAVPLCASWEAKGWSYENYAREPRQIGEHTWQ
ncbi:MAG: hypothetical protein Q7S65_03855 [Nanoarchaeota archaeon]|nr:hypothetical protein [Nanoarchaeota archaeon]